MAKKFVAPLDANKAPGAIVVIGTVAVSGGPIDGIRSHPSQALFDTGATCTCVNEEILTSLGLKPIRSSKLVTPSTGAEGGICRLYRVSLSLRLEKKMVVFINDLEVAGMRVDFSGYKVLIGRDILGRGHFAYDGLKREFSLTLDDDSSDPCQSQT